MTQRLRQPPRRLVEFDLATNSEVNEEGDLIHFAMMADMEQVDFKDALKVKEWNNVTVEKLNSIDKNRTWTLTEQP